MNGLEGQLGGMGVAFSSSLMGLAGSLIVGLLELFAGHGQNRFYRELEEWLSSMTRLGFSSGDGEMSGDSAMFTAVLDQMSEQMEAMRVMFAQSDQTRGMVDEKISDLSSKLERLTDRLEQSAPANSALERVAEGQEKLLAVLSAMEQNDAVDAESRMRLRSIDVQMLHLMEDVAAGRQETLTAIRSDIQALTNALVQALTEIDAGKRSGRG
jgi:septal ring factor EnvC (AmiA/AmiB activator)